LQYGNVLNALNIDIPLFYGLNREIQSFENISALILIGTNPRYEASILNTMLRKQQQNKALPYALFNATTSLRIKHSHLGNSIKSLVAFAENKIAASKFYYNYQNVSLVLGNDSLKGINGGVLQNIFK
jgi:NADH-quinone oxidoreductase subunit G